MTTAIEVVLFDLGGVLLRLRDPYETFAVELSETEFRDRWLLSPAVRSLECGRLEVQEFADALVAEFDLPYGAAEFLQRFKNWPGGLFASVPDIFVRLPNGLGRALLSNTNAVHWQRPDIGGVLQNQFEHLFLSFRTGHLKPDQSAFEDVLSTLPCEPQAIYFLDDNPLNIEAARRCGMRVALTNGEAELLQNLRKENLY